MIQIQRPTLPAALRALVAAILMAMAGAPGQAQQPPAPQSGATSGTATTSGTASQAGAPFTFYAIGDAGNPGTILENTARRASERAARADASGRGVGLLMFLGDNFYPNGLNLPDAKRAALIERVIGPHRPLMARLGRDNVHAITGNHDYYCTAVNDIPYGTCTDGVIAEHGLPEWTFHMKYPVSIRRALSQGGSDSVEIFFVDSSLLLVSRPEGWRPLLDSLETLLRRSASAPGVVWRIIAIHHSPYTVGDHSGYRRWDPKRRETVYIGNCIEDGDDPFRYIQQFVSDQDNCTPRYRAYSDSLLKTIDRGGAKIQVLLAGHDHSLQLLNYPERNGPLAPKIFVISGAGSKEARVKSPSPPREFTHPRNDKEGKGNSLYGYVEGWFEGDSLHLQFIDGRDGQPIDMGKGAREFVVDRSGALAGTR